MVNPVLFNPQWQHNFVSTEDGVRLHYVEVGPRDGVPVVMVHGWADFWFGWRVRVVVEYFSWLGADLLFSCNSTRCAR